MRSEYDLDLLQRHPSRYFFQEMRQTDGVVNSFLAVSGVAATIWSMLGRLPWFFVVVGLLMLWQVVRNYRRYCERVHFAIAERDRAGSEPPTTIAERDRAGIEPPTHPDHQGGR